MRTLLTGNLKPQAGDLVLAVVERLGKHQRIEMPNGRRSRIFPGDEVVVCYGNRYAPDQFEALVGDNLGGCDLVASGGIAATEVCRHDKMTEPTKIIPLGLVGDAEGRRLNVANFRIDARALNTIPIVLVAGTSMNAGKTLTAGSLIRSLAMSGHRVAGIKITGTGSGNDLWTMKDMGATLAMDFTDAGFATTYMVAIQAIEAGAINLIAHAANTNCDIAVIEIADGLEQRETAGILEYGRLKSMSLGLLFAAYDSMGARAGTATLRKFGHEVIAVSGQLARSPLSMREAGAATGLPVLTPQQIEMGALIPAIHQNLRARKTHQETMVSTLRSNDAAIVALPSRGAGLKRIKALRFRYGPDLPPKQSGLVSTLDPAE